MKDIKVLYNEAKRTNGNAEISLYNEAIQSYVESNPYSYITNLEYIITSDIGVKTLKEFVERNGLPIHCVPEVEMLLQEDVRRCGVFGKDDSIFNEAMEWLNGYKNKYKNCFAMYEYYRYDLLDANRYIKTYYSFTESDGVQKRKMLKGMIATFGEAAIPDLVITADSINNNALSQTFEHAYTVDNINETGELAEWLYRVSEDVSSNINESTMRLITDNSLSKQVCDFVYEKNQIYRESVITGSPVEYRFSKNVVEGIKDLIAVNEFCMLFEELQEPGKTLSTTYSLYQELFELGEEFGESDADLVEMLPNPSLKKEATWVANTSDKKTGELPGYIKRNHSIANYGEDEPDQEVIKSDNDNMDIEDYKRPSAMDDKDNNSFDTSSDDSSDDEPPEPKSGSVNNYYYYTYQNSLNKNQNSFNKHNSHRDDHSIHKTQNSRDNSVHKTSNNYDSSHNKRINSDNINGTNDEEEFALESDILKLDLAGINYISEEVGDADDMRPQSDHPIRDIFIDIDRKTVKTQQKAKKALQDTGNVGRAIMKPINRTKQWLTSMINKWKDASETNIKEKMADPHARKSLLKGIGKAITVGAFLKAGLLLNPVFLFLGITKGVHDHNKLFRLRNEMIGELKTEIEIIEEKIKDADSKGDNKAKYQLMRFKNEINKKLLRVGGGKQFAKIL